MTSFDLHSIGWDDSRDEEWTHLAPNSLVPGRVAVQHRGAFGVYTETGERRAELPGRALHDAVHRSELPVVGDWVALEPAQAGGPTIIRAVLDRRTSFSRKVAGLATDEQVLAANIDLTWIAAPLDRGPRLRGIERYLTMAFSGGALPVVVLTKADCADDIIDALDSVASIAPGVDVHITSSVTGEGIEALRGYLAGNSTVALLGPSGAGKSSLINALIGTEHQVVRDVRHDGKGRHTTTARSLIALPSGGVLLDTPGLRELQLWDGDEGLDETFSDITSLAEQCRFRDCSHSHEPGCAVVAALRAGSLAQDRLESYRKLERELKWLHQKQDRQARAQRHRELKSFVKTTRARTAAIKARDRDR